ncbi:peptidyl-prolyl cis-trans isomerase cyclophilin type [Proteiniphilum saccharofermentans]|uniref:peptidylprolyl isomerase n=1 Tax=Proteiniphilum saccharofermentans TaxID=1642647 RepID=A0A1R3T9Z8_9BACT|nr:peptidylprolyl isomerase [Proteiniphilum saccharofermentans]SCD22118.1 peptidyl-prolyl cis-trans isomerase cyclophilin type [Proteiniphilum saccharofermentans]
MIRNILIFILIAVAWQSNAQANYPIIVIETNYGTMKAMLYDDTPVHSNHYLKLIKEGYFDGTLFHRVVKDFVIQGGAQDSRDAPSGARIGGGRTDMELMPEFRENRFHKKGALAAPRRGDNENPQKKSDASQIYIVQGRVYTQGRLDSMEMAVNVPIRNEIIRTHYLPHKEKLDELKAANDASGFNALLDSLLNVVDSLYAIAPGKFFLPQELKEAYTTLGGIDRLDGSYTVFGEVTEGLEVIDKIAALPVDENSRPKTDAKIIRIYIE